MNRRDHVPIALAAWLGLALGVAAPAWTQEENGPKAVPLQDAKLDVQKLKGWGTRSFTYVVDRAGERATLGTVVLRTGLSGDRVEMHDSLALTWRGKEMSLELKMLCKPESLLRPVTIESVGKGEDEFGTFTAQVGAEKAKVEAEGRGVKEIEVPADTLTDHAMFRVFTLLPREKGAAFAIGHTLEVSELNLKGAGRITCEGLDEITLHGQTLKLHKFVFRQGERIVEEAWVDGDGVLRQVRIDQRKVLVEQKAE